MPNPIAAENETTESNTFAPDRELPSDLKFLNELSKNFYWSWNEDCVRLFRDIDPSFWDKAEQNPRGFLKDVNGLRLWQKAEDANYIQRLQEAEKRFREYTAAPPQSFERIDAENPIAYFCAEYGIHNSLPIYSGGLGILAGDHLKSASDLNIPLVAVGLLYRYGYFRQAVAHDGWQEENYEDSFENELALEPVVDENGDTFKILMNIRGRDVQACAWKASVGRIPLYLLDTNLPENDPVDRLITGHLYGGDTETRVVQEQILGIGGLRLLRMLGKTPSVFHLNEGHSAFLTLELVRERLVDNDSLSFLDVISPVREQCVFTTHTPVEAGNDSFDPEIVRACFDPTFIDSLKIEFDDLLELGRTDPEDKTEWFGMTPLAIRMCRSSNGVSEKHGEVSRELWKRMFPDDIKVTSVPITSVTNGVHPATWISPDLKQLYDEKIGTGWQTKVLDPAAWQEAINSLSDADIWKAHQKSKNLLVSYIRERTLRKNTGSKHTIHEHSSTKDLFSANILTIGFARRIAAYKRWNLLMTDLDRLLKLVDDSERPVQFVFAGKAHPQDRKAKNILQELITINHDSNWRNRAVFIEDYDQEVARYLVRGVDVWMNVPRRPLEASGTSGQKVAMNGGLNFSVLDGWWIEGYNKENGFAIGPLEDPEGKTEEELDLLDANSLYNVLENEIVPKYYDHTESELPLRWIDAMRDSLATLTQAFSSDRMVMDYVNRIYRK